jgi:UPF0716 family protein affecting phage T7 exclusion
MVTTNIAGSIGGLLTFLEIILSAGVGFFLLINFRYTVTQSMGMLMSGQMSVEEFQKLSLFTLLGAVLLIIPGFFSDMLGVALQFSFIGTFIAKKIFKLKNKKNRRKDNDDAIDVEIIDVDALK